MRSDWDTTVLNAIRAAKIEVVGQADIQNEAQARAVVALLYTYGNSSSGFIYIEPCLSNGHRRPPDVVICHPEIGLLVIEVKADSIDRIGGIKAGNLLLKRNGLNHCINPIRQAENAMFAIKDAIKGSLGDGQSQPPSHIFPLMNVMVALPNISEADWIARKYDQAYPPQVLLFKETLSNPQTLENHIAQLTRDTLAESHKSVPLTQDHIVIIKRAFGDSAVINEQRPPRLELDDETFGARLDEIVALEKHLSVEQQYLSRLDVSGHPRLIRGVAGSGKSVVLANMVARYISRRLFRTLDLFEEAPKRPRIGVFCFNRTLIPFLRMKINDAYKQHTMHDIPDDCVSVTHLNGVFWNWREQGVIEYVNAKEDVEIRVSNYLEQLRRLAKESPEQHQALLFDAVFVDEGQDFAPQEYELMLEMLKADPETGEKTLIIFYDDAQNLYGQSRPNWKQLGIDVQRGDRSRVMKECFRNPREVIELAFNVLLGSASGEDTPVHTRTFADVYYLKQNKLIEELDDHFRVCFTERSFRKPTIKSFNSRSEEKEWVAKRIIYFIEELMVRPEDILVLFNNSYEYPDTLEQLIGEYQTKGIINGFVKPFGYSQDRDSNIFRQDYITLSTIHGAKGYDAMVVFLVGVDKIKTSKEGRAAFYVGATRTKMWLCITGCDSPDQTPSLLTEALTVNQRI